MICRGCGRDLGDTDFCPACDGEKLYEGKSIIKEFNIFTAFISMYKNHGDYTGRCRRKEYWYAVLLNGILLLLSFSGTYFLPMLYGNGFDIAIYLLSGFCRIFFMFYIFVMIIPIVSLTVRRVHDTGKSAWWVTGIAGMFFTWLYIPSKILSLPFLLAGFITGLYFTTKDSQTGINKYGPNRKGIE